MARSLRRRAARLGRLQLPAMGILLVCLLPPVLARSQEPLPQALREGRTVFVEHPTGRTVAEQLASELETVSQFDIVLNRDETDLLAAILYGNEGVEEFGPGLFVLRESMRLVLVDPESQVVVWDETATGGDTIARLVGNLHDRLVESR